MGAMGIATIDFGSTPVSEASVAVTGQGGFVAASSEAEAFFQTGSTAGNDATAHKALAFLADEPFCDTFVDSVGFTIRVLLPNGVATGQFKIPWVWN